VPLANAEEDHIFHIYVPSQKVLPLSSKSTTKLQEGMIPVSMLNLALPTSKKIKLGENKMVVEVIKVYSRKNSSSYRYWNIKENTYK